MTTARVLSELYVCIYMHEYMYYVCFMTPTEQAFLVPLTRMAELAPKASHDSIITACTRESIDDVAAI